MSIMILCAIDDEEHSEQAAETAIAIAKETSACLMFYMVNPAVLPGPRGPQVHMWDDAYVRSYLDEAARRAKRAGVFDVMCATDRADSIADAIIDRADRHGADFIVVGARYHSRIAELLHRSVSQAIAQRANCPVLIVRRVREWSLGRPAPHFSGHPSGQWGAGVSAP